MKIGLRLDRDDPRGRVEADELRDVALPDPDLERPRRRRKPDMIFAKPNPNPEPN